jgi:antitoxin (DNA-binding transcriptional repressor) of toxin-antitoxin stability system
MKTMEVPANQRQLQAAIRQGEEETIVLTRRGKPVAAVVPIKGIDAETLSLSTSRKFLGILRRSFAQLDSGRTLSLAEMKRRVK